MASKIEIKVGTTFRYQCGDYRAPMKVVAIRGGTARCQRQDRGNKDVFIPIRVALIESIIKIDSILSGK